MATDVTLEITSTVAQSVLLIMLKVEILNRSKSAELTTRILSLGNNSFSAQLFKISS